MGYQNNSRPKKKKELLADISFDLTDLWDDINKEVDKEHLMESVKFIKKTLNKLEKKMSK